MTLPSPGEVEDDPEIRLTLIDTDLPLEGGKLPGRVLTPTQSSGWFLTNNMCTPNVLVCNNHKPKKKKMGGTKPATAMHGPWPPGRSTADNSQETLLIGAVESTALPTNQVASSSIEGEQQKLGGLRLGGGSRIKAGVLPSIQRQAQMVIVSELFRLMWNIFPT
ncbi:uncharacterized protein EI90DRAFT_3017659 [Cantharellus anzutake]|uniref:uncharacterized protein n=1 Tax=Cantharellus anzutake TaxID=1750568 RepID=UPI001904ACF0|nr:uncharacterized protein EI90DRAFT_3017659 [Cantharellus anzutake]KAF8328334.1 hypothetical protein EI90DRAFT_3017659 [Cantharellus anzutake]